MKPKKISACVHPDVGKRIRAARLARKIAPRKFCIEVMKALRTQPGQSWFILTDQRAIERGIRAPNAAEWRAIQIVLPGVADAD